MALQVRPLTPDLWPALEDLFGAKGASNGCWCMYWRIGGAYAKRPRAQNREDLHRIVETGPPPGLVALDGERAVGWAQLTPRTDLRHMDRTRRYQRVDETPVWSISCFYVRTGWRRRGVATALIAAAVEAATAAGAPALEAYPVDKPPGAALAGEYTGRVSTFARAGFREVARRTPTSPIMRRELA